MLALKSSDRSLGRSDSWLVGRLAGTSGTGPPTLGSIQWCVCDSSQSMRSLSEARNKLRLRRRYDVTIRLCVVDSVVVFFLSFYVFFVIGVCCCYSFFFLLIILIIIIKRRKSNNLLLN